MLKRKKNKNTNPIITILWITLGIMVTSFVLSLIGFDGQKAVISNNNLETSLVAVRNIISVDGLRYIIGNSLTNFQILEPIALLIISLIAVSIAENSGIIKYIGGKLKKIKSPILVIAVILISILFTFIGDYSYLILFAFIPLLYKEMGKNPLEGILTVFLAISASYGTGFIFNNNDYILGLLTEKAATIDVDLNYKFNIRSNMYIMISSSIIFSIVLTYCIEKNIRPKLPKVKKQEVEIVDEDKSCDKGFILSLIVFVLLTLITLYMIIEGLPWSGKLLDNEASIYISKLFSNNSPFKEGFPVIIMFIIIMVSTVYKKVNKIEVQNKESWGVFPKLGYIMFLMFFASQLIAIINWTNLGEVIGVKLINFMSTLQFSGVPLILTMFIITILIGLLIPSTINKWLLMSPLTVPLFMRSNITPDFTQFIFKIADGVGKLITPVYIYYIIMIGFIENYSDDEQITIFGTLKIILPTILILIGLWIIIIVGWYIIGLPIGSGIYATL